MHNQLVCAPIEKQSKEKYRSLHLLFEFIMTFCCDFPMNSK